MHSRTGRHALFENALQQAQQAFSRQDWPEAMAQLSRVLERDPEHLEAHLLASYVASYLGRYRDARAHALKAAALPAGGLDSIVDVMSRLRTFNETGEFLKFVAGLGAPSRLPIQLLLHCANQLSLLNLQQEARIYLEEAYRADPDYPPTLVSLGQVMVYLGEFDRANELLKHCLRRAPDIAQAYWLAALLGKHKNPEIDAIGPAMRLRTKTNLRIGDQIMLDFALHRLYDGQHDYEQAWTFLERGLRLKRATLKYDHGRSFELHAALKEVPVQIYGSAQDQKVPIFIVGMHRSGTTLLEQLLSAHDDVAGIGEVYDFTNAMRFATDCHCRGTVDIELVQRVLTAPPDYREVGQRYLDNIGWRTQGRRYFTDKLPSNFLNLGFIAQALPSAHIIHMVRDPKEVCFSNLRELFSEVNPFSYDQVELARYHGLYRDLMRHWNSVLPGRILDVAYRDLVHDTRATMEKVAAFCGLEFQERMLDTDAAARGIATASAGQVRGGIVRDGTSKWLLYAAHLEPMLTGLQP